MRRKAQRPRTKSALQLHSSGHCGQPVHIARFSVQTYAIQLLKVWVIHPINIKPRLGNLRPRAPALGKELPQLLRVVDITSEPAAHANNGNRRGIHLDQASGQQALGIRLPSTNFGVSGASGSNVVDVDKERIPSRFEFFVQRLPNSRKKGPSDGGNTAAIITETIPHCHLARTNIILSMVVFACRPACPFPPRPPPGRLSRAGVERPPTCPA